jgi:hypothetical protein
VHHTSAQQVEFYSWSFITTSLDGGGKLRALALPVIELASSRVYVAGLLGIGGHPERTMAVGTAFDYPHSDEHVFALDPSLAVFAVLDATAIAGVEIDRRTG